MPGEAERLVLHGGSLAGPDGVDRRADIAIVGDTIVALGDVSAEPGDRVIDCDGRLVLPGFIDAHSHADGLLHDDDVQRSLLRQGVTTVIAGQDGVSYAPGDGAYATEYFAAINGPYPGHRGGDVAGYLASIDGTSRLNAGYLVPAGIVRQQVCGRSKDAAAPEQTAAMAALVARGMLDGALGLSTGLDYVPGRFQSTGEIAALCEPVARHGGVYVSHMRGGYEANAAAGVEEIASIAGLVRERTCARLPVHVSHFHADADIVLGQLDVLNRTGVDATFDAYPYIRGCTLLGMPLLPPELSVRPVAEVVAALGDHHERERLRREWFPLVTQNPSLGPQWPAMITLAHIDAPAFDWAHGLTIEEAAQRAGEDAIDFALDVLQASELRANAVMAVRNPRPVSELARIFSHPCHIGGSDGIFIGAHPHPRARGTFARYLREYVRETGTWSWADAVRHLSAAPAARFGLGRRGEVAVGAVADLIVVDQNTVADRATYDEPLLEAVGIDDVIVGGMPVLEGGQLSNALPGRGLRRERAA